MKSTTKSWPHKGEITVKGSGGKKFHGHTVGHVKGKPYSGPGSNKHIVNSTQS